METRIFLLMNKKEVAEIKKQFTPDRCAITRICGCYVNAEKEKLQKYEEMMEKVNTQLKQMEK